MKNSIRKPAHKSFEWDVLDYNLKTREYALIHKKTGQRKTIPKEQYLELVKEQQKN